MEQALVKMGTLDLVKPECPTAQLLNKISEIRLKNLTAKQEAMLRKLNDSFGYSFKILAEKYFGLNGGQVANLSDQEKEALFFLVTERAKKAYNCFFIPFAVCVPVVGWVTFGTSETKRLVRSLNKIKKVVGKNLNPLNLVN